MDAQIIDAVLNYASVVLDGASKIVLSASVITAMTPTPDPTTLLGKIYQYIEIAALVVGRAKDSTHDKI